MTSPRANLARMATLTECMAERLTSLDIRFPEDGDVAALQRKLDEMTAIVDLLAGKAVPSKDGPGAP